jgi:hypothetical protein
MWEECHVERESVKAPAEELGWSLASGRGDLSGLSNDEKTGLKWIRRGLIDLSTISHGCTILHEGARSLDTNLPFMVLSLYRLK